MTGLEAAQKFKVEINKLDRSSQTDVRLEKILHYLNKAQLFLTRLKYVGKDPGPGRLEVNHPVTDDLKALVTQVDSNLQEVNLSTGEALVPFETNHLYYLSSQIQTSKTDCSPSWVNGRYVKPERVYLETQNPFNKSVIGDPIVSIIGNHLAVYNPDFSIEGVKIKYIKRPLEITSSSTLEVPFEDEVIDTAVTMALEVIESQRTKTQPGVNVTAASE